MAIVAIVAVAANLAIGKNGKLPWHYRSDLRFFKQTTVGNAVVMGRRTWESIGKPLPNRLNIVLSRTLRIENQPSVLPMSSRDQVLALRQYLNCDLCVIGGASVYAAFKNEIERWIVTQIPEKIEDADTFMPTNFLDGFQHAETQTLEDDLKVKIYRRASSERLR